MSPSRLLACAVVVPFLAGCGDHRAAACPPARAGQVAFVRAGALVVLDLDGCTQHMVARGVQGPVAWSPDGKWIVAGNALVSAAGGRKLVGLGVWAPRGHALARITRRGGLLLGEPGTRDRRLLADGFGAIDAVYAKNGTLAVLRELRSGRALGPPRREEIWLLRPPRMRPRLLYSVPHGLDMPPYLAAVSPDGRAVFFWPFVDHAISANLDGLPLEVVTGSAPSPRRIVPAMLAIRGYLSWCGHGLVAAAGFDRMATLHKSLIVAAPPRWRTRTLARAGPLSWISPACSPDGRTVAAAAGPNREDVPFGREARSIWLVRLDGRLRTRLTPPPPRGESDEVPQWSADGRFIVFVRAGPTTKSAAARGRLYLVETTGRHRLYGPLADLGLGSNYYGEYGWSWDRSKAP